MIISCNCFNKILLSKLMIPNCNEKLTNCTEHKFDYFVILHTFVIESTEIFTRLDKMCGARGLVM